MIVKIVDLSGLQVIQIFNHNKKSGLWFAGVWDYSRLSIDGKEIDISKFRMQTAIKMLFEQSDIKELLNRFYEAENGIK